MLGLSENISIAHQVCRLCIYYKDGQFQMEILERKQREISF